MKKATIIFLSAMIAFAHVHGQVKIGDNPGTISQGSILELESTSRALTLPRMTTVQMHAIPSPINGMIIFNIDSNCIYLYKANNVWASISADVSAPAVVWPYHSNDSAVGTRGNKEGIISLTGSGLLASGDYSHAEGLNSVSSGIHSWSFGLADTALSAGSSAIGYQNKTAGAYSFALGFQNITGYQSAVALGQENQDSGWASLAMGLRNRISSGVSYSNVLGYLNQVNGGFSNLAVGESNFISGGRANTGIGFTNNILGGNFNSVFGTSNDVQAGNSHITGGENNTIRSGNANSIFGQNNVGDGSYLGVLGKDNSVFYQAAVALGQGNKDSGYASIAGGLNNIISAGVQYSSSLGYSNQLNGGSSNIILGEANIIKAGRANTSIGYTNSVLAGNFGIATGTLNTLKTGSANSIFGQNNIADGSFLGAIGKDNIVFYQSAIALGQGNKDSGYASLSAGLGNTIRSLVQYSNSFGYLNEVQAGSSNTAIGESNIIKSGRAIMAMGYANTVDSSNFSNALGTGNDILKGNSHMASGENNTIKSGNANSVLGQNNFADGSYLGAIGKDNIVFYQAAIALGRGNKDSGYASIAGGLNNIIASDVQYSSSFGFNNQVNGGSSNTILGEANILKSGNSNNLLGFTNTTEGNYNILGGSTNTSKTGSANSIFGLNNFADGSYLGAIGKDNIVFYQSAVALGQGNKDSGYASLAAGLGNTIKNNVQYSSSIGYSNQVNAGSSNTAMGEANIINSGRANVNMGYANTIAANFSSTFGTSNDILAGNSHISGGENNTIRSGNANSIFGLTNFADGSYLGAIGKDNSVYYQSAVALGQGNKDSGWASIAGGIANIIEKNVQYGIAFGSNNTMTRNPALSPANAGIATFSAGLYNINSGYGSVALGGNNRPTNLYSLSANYNTISNSHAMSAFGHFNDTIAAVQGVSYDPEEMLFSIGNGSNDLNRRNSFTMLRNGFTTINTTAETGPNTPRAELDVKGTGAIIVPVGTTAQRPATPVTGMIRFCTDCPGGPVLQGYDGTNWVNL